MREFVMWMAIAVISVVGAIVFFCVTATLLEIVNRKLQEWYDEKFVFNNKKKDV